jgi:hypothetical protein
MRLLKRLVQRLLIFGLGICCVWLIVFVVFETADRRLPWIMAVASTYGIAAYIILPRAIRLGLRIIQHKHVPSYTITGDGLPAPGYASAASRGICDGWLVGGRSAEPSKLMGHDPCLRTQHST